MKKICFLICIFASTFANAQEKMIIKETFENNRFQWDEFYEKDYSGSIENGYYILKNESKGFLVRSTAELPITIDNNFKITFKFLIPKVSDDYYFGIIFNYEDENNYNSFLVSERKYQIWNKANDVLSLAKHGRIILKSGKNKEVSIVVEKKGTKLIFSVDNMEAVSITRNLKFNTFGFQVEDKNTIKVDEVIIEQRAEE